MKTEREVLDIAVNALSIIKIYCETADTTWYDNEALKLLSQEFKPIVRECERALKEIRKV